MSGFTHKCDRCAAVDPDIKEKREMRWALRARLRLLPHFHFLFSLLFINLGAFSVLFLFSLGAQIINNKKKKMPLAVSASDCVPVHTGHRQRARAHHAVDHEQEKTKRHFVVHTAWERNAHKFLHSSLSLAGHLSSLISLLLLCVCPAKKGRMKGTYHSLVISFLYPGQNKCSRNSWPGLKKEMRYAHKTVYTHV